MMVHEQHGFIGKKYTVSQLLLRLNEWTMEVDKGKSVTIVHLDFTKAFNTVSHNKLLNIVSTFHIHGEIGGWIEALSAS